MRDAIQMVIHHDGKLIGGKTVRTMYDIVADIKREVLVHGTGKPITERDPGLVGYQSYRQAPVTRWRHSSAGSGIDRTLWTGSAGQEDVLAAAVAVKR